MTKYRALDESGWCLNCGKVYGEHPLMICSEGDLDKEATRQVNERVPMRTFETGATRTNDAGKPDYEGFLSPLVIERFGKYMNKHRTQEDGTLRNSDNWQMGIPRAVYMKSMWRHFVDVWRIHRSMSATGLHIGHIGGNNLEEALCAVLFNVQGYLHELLNERKG